MKLDNKVALITGAGSGIGRACAISLADAGARVGLIGRTEDELKQVARAIDATRGDGTAHYELADVSKADQVQRATDAIAAKFGRLDVVVANAGINGVWAPIEDLKVEEFDKTIAINLAGTFYTIKSAVGHLKRAGKGSIIVVSSINGTRVFSNTGATAYSTTKAGQLAMAQMLALELAPAGIRVNVICPGAIETNIDDNTQQRNVEQVKIKADFEREIPLTNKPGTAEEVADLALFLASDASRHITGTPVWIDGGQSLLRG